MQAAAYITLEEAAELENIGYDTMQKRIRRSTQKNVIMQKSDTGGRDIVLVSVNSLSKMAQAAFERREAVKRIADAADPDVEAAEEKPAQERPWYVDADYTEGAYFTYYAVEDTVVPEGISEYKIIVEAELPGAAYNVEPGIICDTLVYIDGYDRVRNEDGWIIESGTEIEAIESLRQRCLNSRAENARLNPDRKLKSIVESISGVVTADIDSQAPRGEGTVDIIITGAEGIADETLIQKVEDAIKEMEGSYGDYLVKSAESVKQDFALTVYIESGISVAGYEEQIRAAILDLMDVSKRKELNTLYRDAIIGKLISTIQGYKKTDITVPAADVIADKGSVIVAGDIQITVKNIG